MKPYRDSGGLTPLILNSDITLDGSQLPASYPKHFTPGAGAPGTH